jgi:hypothetical protein
MEVVTGQFPVCWEMEIMDNGSADEEDGDSDVYARYVLSILCSTSSLIVALASGCHTPRCP